jgi:hypothetical protein
VIRTAEVEELKRLKEASQSCVDCRKMRMLGKQPAICEHTERTEVRVPEEDLEAAALGV